MKVIIISILIVIIGISACNSKSTSVRKPVTNIQITPANKVVTFGNQFTISIQSKITKSKIIQIELYINNKLIEKSDKDEFSVTLNSKDYLPGKYSIKTIAKNIDNKIGTNYSSIAIVSDIKPEQFTYKIIETLPHNTSYFTEGLEFYNEKLFESTGNYDESFIYSYNPKTKKVYSFLKNESQYFGEGITILKDKIYQLTYVSHKAFVYDVKTFKKIKEFSFDSKEGWGLTNNGELIIMSNGTSKISFINTESFQVVKSIEVNHPNGFISNINELEYVNGIIYANIWTRETILKIDAETGRVLAIINMKGLLNTFNSSKVDVLNGIAYNPKEDLFYITGKYWPKMFKVRFEKALIK